jgi:hypothetical protein
MDLLSRLLFSISFSPVDRRLGAKAGVRLKRDNGDFQHSRLGEGQRPEFLANPCVRICLHEQTRAGNVGTVPDLPDEAFGVQRASPADFSRYSRSKFRFREALRTTSRQSEELHK